jgi:hypothetical protein
VPKHEGVSESHRCCRLIKFADRSFNRVVVGFDARIFGNPGVADHTFFIDDKDRAFRGGKADESGEIVMVDAVGIDGAAAVIG